MVGDWPNILSSLVLEHGKAGSMSRGKGETGWVTRPVGSFESVVKM